MSISYKRKLLNGSNLNGNSWTPNIKLNHKIKKVYKIINRAR